MPRRFSRITAVAICRISFILSVLLCRSSLKFSSELKVTSQDTHTQQIIHLFFFFPLFWKTSLLIPFHWNSDRRLSNLLEPLAWRYPSSITSGVPFPFLQYRGSPVSWCTSSFCWSAFSSSSLRKGTWLCLRLHVLKHFHSTLTLSRCLHYCLGSK